MSIIKNVSGPYTINTINHDDPIILDSNVVIINGNLTVKGNTTTITSTDTNIYDNIITLNAGLAASSAPVLNAGINVNRGSSANVAIRWNELYQRWQITNDGSVYANVSSYTTGQNIQRVQDDPAPQLGGNLSTTGYALVNTAGTIYMKPATSLKLDGNLDVKMYTTSPAAVPYYNTLWASNVSAGGSGLYVTTGDSTVLGEELITKKKAIVYSIIF